MEKHFKEENSVLTDTHSGEIIDKPTVTLAGEDGNAFTIIGKCMKALKQNVGIEIAKQFQSEAMSGDYDHLLQTAMKYCNVK